jgi:hypothetical protein
MEFNNINTISGIACIHVNNSGNLNLEGLSINLGDVNDGILITGNSTNININVNKILSGILDYGIRGNGLGATININYQNVIADTINNFYMECENCTFNINGFNTIINSGSFSRYDADSTFNGKFNTITCSDTAFIALDKSICNIFCDTVTTINGPVADLQTELGVIYNCKNQITSSITNPVIKIELSVAPTANSLYTIGGGYMKTSYDNAIDIIGINLPVIRVLPSIIVSSLNSISSTVPGTNVIISPSIANNSTVNINQIPVGALLVDVGVI